VPGGCVTCTAVMTKQRDTRTWPTYSLAIALAPFRFLPGRMGRPDQSDLSRPWRGSLPMARDRPESATGASTVGTSAWSLAWPAGMVNLLWASGGTTATVPPGETVDKGVIWGQADDDRNETRFPGVRASVPRQVAGPDEWETLPPGDTVSRSTATRPSR
jgi:hypothetical protein